MMSPFELSVTLITTAVIFSHCLTLAADIKRHAWDGHLLEFTAFTLSIAALGAGAAGALLGWPPAVILLLVGIAGTIVIDRRKRRTGDRRHLIKE